ncbi:hypothetical protein BT93_E0659 [Corymbia citriodora subsp. variegata]|nr:hypothetical protein BT93_E0659 [Corymbia citriodora subsp. variegata]
MIQTSLAKPLCHPNESSALMEFKQNLRTTTVEFGVVYSKVDSWSLDGYGDCCTWDGIECDEGSGHVTGLDLSNSCLFGTIIANTSLFRLLHLELLNLAWNDFNSSSIPYGFGNLSRLQHLNLSNSQFSGKVPLDIPQLSGLISLDLSLLWGLEVPDINNFLHNLTMLRELDLSLIYTPSPFPHVLANFSSLKLLKLQVCGLHGEFPVSIFQLPNLEILNISDNDELYGFIPKQQWSNPLKSLSLGGTNFSGEIPVSIGSLVFLNELSIGKCNFSGSLPTSLGNLSQLAYLDISQSNFKLSFNNLQGEIPNSLGKLNDLLILGLKGNNLNGPVYLHKLKNLEMSFLDFNNITFVNKTEINATLPRLSILSLDSCNLHEFPKFLGCLTKLERVSLSHNKIGGSIPMWMWNGSKETLMYMDLSHNFLTGFENNLINLPLANLIYLDLSSNLLKTALPNPPPPLFYYNISNNFLFGEIQSVCRGKLLGILDLSINSLNGTIPSCLAKSYFLSVLNLGKNKLEGMILHAYPEGIVRRSLANCKWLEYLNFGYNQILDGFPLWLSELTKLIAIILKSNKFHGPIETYRRQFNFSNLHIMDLSNNSFNGDLPSTLLQSFYAMKVIVDQDQLEYLNTIPGEYPSMYIYVDSGLTVDTSWATSYGMKLMNKGTEREHSKVPYTLMEIDFSSNKFGGCIPDLVGDLKSLLMLNLSNNILTGFIPPSLANLTMLESLDLSQNKLSGEIPQQLAQLTCLSSFDVSRNRFSGPIPRGRQFDTFGANSFAMNKGLCGSPLPGVRIKLVVKFHLHLRNLTQLVLLDVSFDKLRGKIPSSLQKLKDLKHLKLQSNNMNVTMDVDSLFELKNLQILDLSFNNIYPSSPRLASMPLF